MRVDPTHLFSDEHAVLHPKFRFVQCFGFWANPVPSLDDQVRMLQQDLRVQPSSLRSRHPMRSCLLIASSSVEHVERVLAGLVQMPLSTSRTSRTTKATIYQLKQTMVVHLLKHIAHQKNLYGTNTVFFPSTPDHKTTHSFRFVHALPSRVGTVCFRFVFHRTARSAIHGRLFYLLTSSPCFPLCCFRLAMGCF